MTQLIAEDDFVPTMNVSLKQDANFSCWN